jgi:hypothetical protein
MGKTGAGTALWAALRADVDIVKVKLQALRTQAQRTVEDVDMILAGPPFTTPTKPPKDAS